MSMRAKYATLMVRSTGSRSGCAEGFQLFQINVFEAGQFFEDAVGGLVEALMGLQEAAHEAPVSFFRAEIHAG